MDNKKRNWILGAVSLVAALAILGMAMANTILARLAPDKYVLLSLLEMKNMADKEQNKISLGPDKERSFELNLKEIDGIYDNYKDTIEGWGVFFSIANNSTDDLKINTGLQNTGVNLMDLSIYSSGSQLGVKIPGLLNQYVMVNLENFKENYDQSILTRYLGHIENEDVGLLNDSISLLKTSLKGQVLGDDTLLTTHLEKLTMELVKNMDVKHIGTTKVLINNKEKKANKFLATIDGEVLKNFIQSSTKLIFNDPDINDIRLTFQPYFETDELEQIFYDAIDQISFSDIEITLAIDKNKQIVNTEILTTSRIYDKEIKVTYQHNLSGSQNIFNTVDAHLMLESLDKSLKVFLNKDLEAKEDNFSLTSRIALDKDTKLSLELLGDLLVDKDEIVTRLDANKIELKAEDPNNTSRILGSGAFETATLKGQSIDVPKEELLDLFSLGPIQMFDIISRVGVQFYNIGNMLDIL